MTPVHTYQVVDRDRSRTPERFETLGEAVRFSRKLNETEPGRYTFERVRPGNPKRILEKMLAERGMGHLAIWYRPSRPQGWMVCEEYEGPGYQRAGYTFSQAAEMIRGKTLESMFLGTRRK